MRRSGMTARAHKGVLGFVALLIAALPVATNSGSAFEAPEVIAIAAGPFIAGSDSAEREAAYQLDEQAYGHSVTRKNGWYDREGARAERMLPAYRITRNLITNREYSAFVKETGHRRPQVSLAEWKGYRLVHPFERTVRHAWRSSNGPAGRADHPVVLVSWHDANAYAAWLTAKTNHTWRLPSEDEWLKAARGTDGRRFPWGDDFDPALLNSHDKGPFDTMPVGSFPDGASTFGMLDAAGQVFEWTSAPAGDNRHIVKGGSWDDKGCGVCRPAARHSRPDQIKHILIGFRLVRE